MGPRSPMISREAARPRGGLDRLCWPHLALIRRLWKGNLVLKGVLNKHDVKVARDHGVNDFMAKPFSVDNIYKVLQRITDAPRQFVTTQTYFGPCRRRSKVGPPKGGERRKESERVPRVPWGLRQHPGHHRLFHTRDHVVDHERGRLPATMYRDHRQPTHLEVGTDVHGADLTEVVRHLTQCVSSSRARGSP